jgi:hypothetical protein
VPPSAYRFLAGSRCPLVKILRGLMRAISRLGGRWTLASSRSSSERLTISGRRPEEPFKLSPVTALAPSKAVWDALADRQLETISPPIGPVQPPESMSTSELPPSVSKRSYGDESSS